MNKTSEFFISTSTAGGNADYSPNASGVNLPTQPSVYDLNRIMSPLAENLKKTASTDSDALFGTHIKEGIEIVKDWVRSGKK
jgi:hypothetical protein